MQNYKVELLDINNKRFDYSYFEGDSLEVRSLKVYICFRTMFLIDQLHDFLEQEERNALVPPPGISKQPAGKTNADIRTIYQNLLKSYNFGISSFYEKLNNQISLEELKENELNNGKKIKSSFLDESLDFFSLFDIYTTDAFEKRRINKANEQIIKTHNEKLEKYNQKKLQAEKEGKNPPFPLKKTTLTDSDFEKLDENNSKYLILTPKENKYKILDEILEILGYSPVNMQEKFFEKNNVPVACSKGYEYIKTFSGFEYLSRYSSLKNEAPPIDNEILITVDADKSKFNVSDIIKRICDITFGVEDNYAHFVKTLATEYDAAGTSGTESLLQKIVISANKQSGSSKKRKTTKQGLQIDNIGNKSLKQNYIITLNGIKIMDFTFTKEANTESKYFNMYRNYKRNGFKFNWKPEYGTKEYDIKYLAKSYKMIDDFFKSYEFEDGSTLVQDTTSRLNTIMKKPPFSVDNFIFTETKPKKGSTSTEDPSLITEDKYRAYVEGIHKIEEYTSELIDSENLYSLIFPDYKPVVNLRINTFFEQTTNSKIKDYLQNISSVPDKIDFTLLDCKDTVSQIISIRDNLYEFMINKNIIKNKSSAKEYVNNLLNTTDFNLDNFYLDYCSQMENGNTIIIQLEHIRNLLKAIHATEFISYDEIFTVLYPKDLTFFSQGNNSVNAITTYVKDNIKLTDNKLTHIFAFKTLGDFGQVLAFFFYNTNGVVPMNKYKYFVTFDRICARLSAVFNHGTLFENVNLVVAPLQPFEYKFSSDVNTLSETMSVALLTSKLKLKN